MCDKTETECVERLASILYWRRYPGNDLAEAALPHAALGTHIYTHVQYDAKHGIRAAKVSALEEEFRDFNLTYSIGGQV